MNTSLITYAICLIIGILMNFYITKVTEIIFKKKTNLTIIPVRIIALGLVINSALAIYHIISK